MNKLIGLPKKYKSFKEYYLNESSLSRLYSKMRDHDCGIISAFRNAEDCGMGRQYTRKENLQRNAKLLAQLTDRKLLSTRVLGGFIENFGSENADAPKGGETSMFVCDTEDTGRLRDILFELGQEYDQDSILMIPKGESAYLLSTNECPDGYPGEGKIGVVKNLGQINYGKESTFFSRVDGRPFFFEAVENKDHILPGEWVGKYACHTISKSNWQDINIPSHWKEIEEINENWTELS